MHPSVASSTSNVVLEYTKRNSHGHHLLHLEQDLELMGAFLPFPTPCYDSAVKIADNCWRLLVNEPYPQLRHNIKMVGDMGGTMYRDPMKRLTFCYVHCEQCRTKLR